jgi:hypothetical protein
MTIQLDEAIPRVRDRFQSHDDDIMTKVGDGAMRAQEVAGDIIGRVQDAVGEAAPIVASALQEQLVRAQARVEHEIESQPSADRDKAAAALVVVVVAAIVLGALALILKRRRSSKKRNRRAKRATSRARKGATTSA